MVALLTVQRTLCNEEVQAKADLDRATADHNDATAAETSQKVDEAIFFTHVEEEMDVNADPDVMAMDRMAHAKRWYEKQYVECSQILKKSKGNDGAAHPPGPTPSPQATQQQNLAAQEAKEVAELAAKKLAEAHKVAAESAKTAVGGASASNSPAAGAGAPGQQG